MRKLIYAINLSIDGCLDHTKISPDDSLHEYWSEVLRGAGTLLYGRVTYELMVPFWPDLAKTREASKAILEFADTFTALEKVVFSKTLKDVSDNKTRILNGDLSKEISKLKKENGKAILAGGVAFPSELIALGLVDEFLFVVHPVIVGEGRRLMEGVTDVKSTSMNLMDSRSFASGAVAVRYSRI